MLLIWPFYWHIHVLHFTHSSSNLSQSSIHMSAGPFWSTTKKLHDNSVLLCLIITLHTPYCGMQELLCARNTTFCLCTYSIQLFGFLETGL